MRRACLGASLVVLVAALGLAGALKVWKPHPLAGEVMQSARVSPGHWEWLTASVRVLGCFELAFALALLVPRLRRLALAGATSLWLGFLAWDTLRWAAGGPAACGCFGEWELVVTWSGVVLKHAILLACLLCAARGGVPWGLRRVGA